MYEMTTFILRRLCLLGRGATFRQISSFEAVACTPLLIFQHNPQKYKVPSKRFLYPQFHLDTPKCCIRYYSKKIDSGDESKEKEKKLSIFKRFKQLYRDYWYVLVPVHLVTSAGWFGGFYYLAKR